MAQTENFDVVVLGSGQGGKQLAWHLGRSGKKVAVVERRWVGGSLRGDNQDECARRSG